MLTKRQEEVLQAIVRQYTTTGQPVGSKALVDHLAKKVSSATIRNEMAVLEHERSTPVPGGYRPSWGTVITSTTCWIRCR